MFLHGEFQQQKILSTLADNKGIQTMQRKSCTVQSLKIADS